MIYVVTKQNRDQYRALMDELFRIRYTLFVEGRGWRALEREDHLDIDQYDTDDTIYIIKCDGSEIVGGGRLRPTTVSHMLKEVFGDLCSFGGAPVGKDIYECSRVFVARRHPNRRAIFAEILFTAAQYCVDHGIVRLTGILETWWLNSYLAMGLKAEPLGLPQGVDGMSLLAVAFGVDAAVRDGLAARLELLQRPSSRERTPMNDVKTCEAA